MLSSSIGGHSHPGCLKMMGIIIHWANPPRDLSSLLGSLLGMASGEGKNDSQEEVSFGSRRQRLPGGKMFGNSKRKIKELPGKGDTILKMGGGGIWNLKIRIYIVPAFSVELRGEVQLPRALTFSFLL